MARQARMKSSTGIYHIMMRGIHQDNLFHDTEDKERFLTTLIRIKEMNGIKIYGYCLMDNHLHLLLKEGEEDIGTTMKRLGVGYVYWFNNKYKRKGHLFQDRYKSQPVEDDVYLLSVLRYIHQNPLKAKIVENIEDYPWSSYGLYLKTIKSSIIERKDILTYFGKTLEEQIIAYEKYMKESTEDRYLEVKIPIRITDEELMEKMRMILKGEKLEEMNREKRNETIKKLKKIEGASIRQISRVTGIGRNIIAAI